MKLLKQRLINYLNYTNIHEYSSDTKTKKAPQTGALPSSIIYILLTQLIKEALLLQNFGDRKIVCVRMNNSLN